MRYRVCQFIVIACIATMAPETRAKAPAISPEARVLYKAGRAEYSVGNLKQALAKFEAAAKLVAHPTIILALAQCHRQLGRPRKALFFYRLYQSKVAETARYSDVQEHIRRLEGQVAARDAAERAKRAPGSVTLRGVPPGAEVLADGLLRAQAPLTKPLELTPGKHTLELRQAGVPFWRREIAVLPASAVTLHVRTATSRPVPATSPTQLQLSPERPARAVLRRSGVWLITAIATSALAVGAEVTALILTGQANEEYGDTPAYRNKRNAAIALHVVAGVAAATAVVGWVFYARGGEKGAGQVRAVRARVSVAPLPGGAAVTGVMRF